MTNWLDGFEIVFRLMALGYIIIVWKAHRTGKLPVRLNGSNKDVIVYTSWRMYLAMGVTLIVFAIPLIVLGSNFFTWLQIRDQPIPYINFLSAALLMPASWIIATIGQVHADRQEKPKRKAK